MTATMTELLQSLDWQPPCQIPSCLHGRPPITHTVTLLPCECFHLACDGCAGILARNANQLLANEGPRQCHGCHAIVVVLRIEPLP